MRMIQFLCILALMATAGCGVHYHEESTPKSPGYDVSHYRPNTDPEYPARYQPGYADTQAPIRYDDDMNYERTDFGVTFDPLPW